VSGIDDGLGLSGGLREVNGYGRLRQVEALVKNILNPVEEKKADRLQYIAVRSSRWTRPDTKFAR
jgi:hypothetical protein